MAGFKSHLALGIIFNIICANLAKILATATHKCSVAKMLWSAVSEKKGGAIRKEEEEKGFGVQTGNASVAICEF